MGQIERDRVVSHAPAQRRRGPPDADGRASARLGECLRRLREGYGYTLRKIEEKSASIGEPIDNSQLSRFEKGKALPSFDKLRALARIFNVSLQHFSDVLDLEEFEAYKPVGRDYDALLAEGADLYARGEHGRAFVTFERALEKAENEGGARATPRVAEARWRMAAALKALGKISMSERELREILRLGDGAGSRVRLRAVLQLAFVYRDLSDLYLARVLAREALQLAEQEGDLRTQAAVLNTIGNIEERDEPKKALEGYERALTLLTMGGLEEDLRLTVLINLGGCLVKANRFDDGVSRLQEALSRSRSLGLRRQAALALTRLGEAWLQAGQAERAGRLFSESDTLASESQQPYHDILFLNAFHRWALAAQEGNPTRERIAFGRLRHLRPLLERRFPEVEAFDAHVESHRRRMP